MPTIVAKTITMQSDQPTLTDPRSDFPTIAHNAQLDAQVFDVLRTVHDSGWALLSTAEIAEEIGRSTSSVRRSLHRLRERKMAKVKGTTMMGQAVTWTIA